MHCILDKNGNLLVGMNPDALNALAMTLYKEMSFLRMADQKAINLQRTGKIGTYPSCLGQEAIDIAAGLVLSRNDIFVPYYRDQGILLHRGYSFRDILTYWGGSEFGSAYTGNKDFPVCVPIATQYTQAAGIASALKLQKRKDCVLVTGGEGSTSKGDFYEALNVASLWHLPVVFLIKNNQWAISTPSKNQTKLEKYTDKAASVGMKSIRVDGNDAIAMIQVLGEAVSRARSNKGPIMIEAVTYRLGDHTTADDATKYRSNEELKRAWENEPIKRLRNFLYNNGLLTKEKDEELSIAFKEAINEQVMEYENNYGNESIEDMFGYMYEDNSHLHDQLNEAKNDI